MVGCGVLSCKTQSERKVDGITFHPFHFDPEIKMKWLVAIGQQNWQPMKYSKICSIDFDDDAFIYKTKKVQLKPYSVPKKHIHIESSADLASISKENAQKLSLAPIKIRLQEVQNIQPKLCLVGNHQLTVRSIKYVL